MSGGGVIEREEENWTGTSNSSVDDELSVPEVGSEVRYSIEYRIESNIESV